MSTPPDPKRRNSATQAAIVDAAWALTVEEGYGRLTVEGIARHAGVGKQTIYRWWPSKEAVLLEGLKARTSTTAQFPDTGDILSDLSDPIAQVATFLSSDESTPFLGLLAAAQSDPQIAEALLDQMIRPRVEACIERLEKAQAQGQLRTDVDPLDVIELLFGPIYYRLVLHTRPLSASDTRDQIRRVFEGLTP